MRWPWQIAEKVIGTEQKPAEQEINESSTYNRHSTITVSQTFHQLSAAELLAELEQTVVAQRTAELIGAAHRTYSNRITEAIGALERLNLGSDCDSLIAELSKLNADCKSLRAFSTVDLTDPVSGESKSVGIEAAKRIIETSTIHNSSFRLANSLLAAVGKYNFGREYAVDLQSFDPVVSITAMIAFKQRLSTDIQSRLEPKAEYLLNGVKQLEQILRSIPFLSMTNFLEASTEVRNSLSHILTSVHNESFNSIDDIRLIASLRNFNLNLSELSNVLAKTEKELAQEQEDKVIQSTSLQNKIERETSQLLSEFRSSSEARSLRLLREVQNEGGFSISAASSVKKLLKNLADTGVDGVIAHLERFKEGLVFTDEDRQAIIALFGGVEVSAPRTESDQESIRRADEESAPQEMSSGEAINPNVIEGELAGEIDFRKVYLEDLGIVDPTALERLSKNYSIAAIQSFEQALEDLPLQLRHKILEINPTLLESPTRFDLQEYTREVLRTIQTASMFEGYQVFDWRSFPEHYADPEVLARTQAAMSFLLDTIQKVKEEVQQLETESRGQHDIPEDQRDLIEQLTPYVTNKYLAYGILRFGFFYQGSYHTNGTPQGFRDRLLQAVFEKKPHPSDVRLAEKELLAAGFLSPHINSKHTDGLIGLSQIKNIQDPRVKELLVRLTDKESLPSKDIRLPLHDDS
jgi:hypothetical protein